jgi:hypothetical protein
MPREERIRMVNEYMEFTSVGQFFKATELAHLSEKRRQSFGRAGPI